MFGLAEGMQTDQTGCQPCTVGTYQDLIGQAEVTSCKACRHGSGDTGASISVGTTDFSGCIHPDVTVAAALVSGYPLTLTDVVGQNLRGSHSVEIMINCGEGAGIGFTTGVGNDDGTQYDFSPTPVGTTYPAGGTYKVCWCAGAPSSAGVVQCSAKADFDHYVGTLVVDGPYFGHYFYCTKGRVCVLPKILGYGLQTGDEVFISRSCNENPVTKYRGVEFDDRVATISESLTSFPELTDLGLKPFEATFDFRLRVLRPTVYTICWRRPDETTGNDFLSFGTEVGSLQLEGPDSGQERACPRGEPCELPDVEGVNFENIDQVMVLFACGKGVTVDDSPNNGTALAISVAGIWNKYSFGDGLLHSDAGIYRVCWCRNGGLRIDPNSPSARSNEQVDANVLSNVVTPTVPMPDMGDAGVEPRLSSASAETTGLCDLPELHTVDLGILTVKGVYKQFDSCVVSHDCTLVNPGIGLVDGDFLMIKPGMGDCTSSIPVPDWPGSPDQYNVTDIVEGRSFPSTAAGTEYAWGTLPLEVNPGLYSKCWCSTSEGAGTSCNRTQDYQAWSGNLRVMCPAGYYEMASSTSPSGFVCKICQKGFFCTGAKLGNPPLLTTEEKKTCTTGRTISTDPKTTPGEGAVQAADCYCKAGYEDSGLRALYVQEVGSTLRRTKRWVRDVFVDTDYLPDYGGTATTAGGNPVPSGSCMPCAVARYKDREGPFLCHDCPNNTITFAEGSINNESCVCSGDSCGGQNVSGPSETAVVAELSGEVKMGFPPELGAKEIEAQTAAGIAGSMGVKDELVTVKSEQITIPSRRRRRGVPFKPPAKDMSNAGGPEHRRRAPAESGPPAARSLGDPYDDVRALTDADDDEADDGVDESVTVVSYTIQNDPDSAAALQNKMDDGWFDEVSENVADKMGLDDLATEELSAPALETVILNCSRDVRPFSGVPAHVTAQSAADCVCVQGYGYQQYETDAGDFNIVCELCEKGKYKYKEMNEGCLPCSGEMAENTQFRTPGSRTTMGMGSTTEGQCICAEGSYGWYAPNEAGDELVFSCMPCPFGFFCDGINPEPQGCDGNSFCGDDDGYMYQNAACVPVPPGQANMNRRRTLMNEIYLTQRNTTGTGAKLPLDCRCVRGTKEGTNAGDDACDIITTPGTHDFIVENGDLGLPLCVPKVVNASIDPASIGRRRGGSTTNIKMCIPCEKGKFKVNVGNEDCRDSCPMNMETEPGAWKVEQCFCQKPLYRDGGEIAAAGFFFLSKKSVCEPCPTNKGAVYCPGGFTSLSEIIVNEKDDVVVQQKLLDANSSGTKKKRVLGINKRPQADEGSFMIDDRTGLAMECYTEVEPDGDGDDKSVCYGNCDYCETGWIDTDGLYQPCMGPDPQNSHVSEERYQLGTGGHKGFLCGSCSYTSARDEPKDPCGECFFNWAMVSSFGMDLETKAFIYIFVAALAATSGGAQKPLHTVLIRTFMAFMASVSPLKIIDWSKVETFSWTKDAAQQAAAEYCNAIIKAEEEQIAKMKAVCREEHKGDQDEKEKCEQDIERNFQGTNMDQCVGERMRNFTTFQYPEEIDEYLDAIVSFNPLKIFDGVFQPPTFVFACMGVNMGENLTVPGRDCVVPGVEIKDHPGLLTGPPMQQFEPCHKPNPDPDWDWESPVWNKENTCGPYGEKCEPLDSCIDETDWDTCPPMRYRVMVVENKAKHTYPAMMWALYVPMLAVLVYLTVLVLMFIAVPCLKNCLGMTDEEIFNLAGVEEDMGPELENDEDEDNALQKMQKAAQRKLKVRAFEARVKDLVKREKVHPEFADVILAEIEYLTHERFELIEADEWADLNSFQREKVDAAVSDSMKRASMLTKLRKSVSAGMNAPQQDDASVQFMVMSYYIAAAFHAKALGDPLDPTAQDGGFTSRLFVKVMCSDRLEKFCLPLDLMAPELDDKTKQPTGKPMYDDPLQVATTCLLDAGEDIRQACIWALRETLDLEVETIGIHEEFWPMIERLGLRDLIMLGGEALEAATGNDLDPCITECVEQIGYNVSQELAAKLILCMRLKAAGAQQRCSARAILHGVATMALPPGTTREEIIASQIEEAEESRVNASEIVKKYMSDDAVKRIADLDFANTCLLKRTLKKKGGLQLLRTATVRTMMRILEECADTEDDAAALNQLANKLQRLVKSDEKRSKQKIKLPQLDKKKHITLHLKCVLEATPPPHVAVWTKIAMEIDKDERLNPDSCLLLLEILDTASLEHFNKHSGPEQVAGLAVELLGDEPKKHAWPQAFAGKGVRALLVRRINLAVGLTGADLDYVKKAVDEWLPLEFVQKLLRRPEPKTSEAALQLYLEVLAGFRSGAGLIDIEGEVRAARVLRPDDEAFEEHLLGEASKTAKQASSTAPVPVLGQDFGSSAEVPPVPDGAAAVELAIMELIAIQAVCGGLLLLRGKDALKTCLTELAKVPYWELRMARYATNAPRSSIRAAGANHQAIGTLLRLLANSKDPEVAKVGRQFMLQYLVLDECLRRKMDCDLLLEQIDSRNGLEEALKKADEAVSLQDNLRTSFLQWDLSATRTLGKPPRNRAPKPPPGTVELDALINLLAAPMSGTKDDPRMASRSRAQIVLRKRLIPRLEAHGVDPFEADTDGMTCEDLCLSLLEIAQPSGSIEEIAECAAKLAMDVGGLHEDDHVHEMKRTDIGTVEPEATFQNRKKGMNLAEASAEARLDEDGVMSKEMWRLWKIRSVVGPLLRRANLDINQTLKEAQQVLLSAEKSTFDRAMAKKGETANTLLREATAAGSVRYALRALFLLLPAHRSVPLAIEVLVIAFIQVLAEVKIKPDYFYKALKSKASTSNGPEEPRIAPTAEEAVILECAQMVLTPAGETEPGEINEAMGAGIAPNFDPTLESPFQRTWLKLVQKNARVLRELQLVVNEKALRRLFFFDGLHPARFHNELRELDEETFVLLTKTTPRLGNAASPVSIWPFHEDVKKLPMARKLCVKYMDQNPIDDDEGGLAILTSLPVDELELLDQDYKRRMASTSKGGVLERYHLLKAVEDSALGSSEGIRNLAEDLPIEKLRELVDEPVISMALEDTKAGMLYRLDRAITVAGREKGYPPPAAAFQASALRVMAREQLKPMLVAFHRDPSGRESLDLFESELSPRIVRMAFMNLHKPALCRALSEHALPISQVLAVLVEVENHSDLASVIVGLRDYRNPRPVVTRLLESDAGKKALNRAALAMLEDSDALDETAEDGVLKILKEGVGSWGSGLLALSRSEARIVRAKKANQQDPSHPSWMKTSINLVKTVSKRTEDVRNAIFFSSDDDRIRVLSQLTVIEMQKLVTACNASKDPEKAGQSVAKALVRLAEEQVAKSPSDKKELTKDDEGDAPEKDTSKSMEDMAANAGVRGTVVRALKEAEMVADEVEEEALDYNHIDLHSRVILARIGNLLDYALHRRNVSNDKVLSVLLAYSHDELEHLEKELNVGKRPLVRKTLTALLQMKKREGETASGAKSNAKRPSTGHILHSQMTDGAGMLQQAMDSVEDTLFGDDDTPEPGKFLTDEDATTLVDALERVLDEGILDEENLIEMTHDLTPQATLALLEIAKPSTFWQKMLQDVLGFDRRDSLGLKEDSASALVAACVELPKFRVIEVCEIVAAEQDEGSEELKRLTGIMERVDLFVSNKAHLDKHHLQIARNYLMLMLEMRTLSAQAVHSVVKDLPDEEIKLWLRDLYGKDAIDLQRPEGSGEGERLFGLFRRRMPGQSLPRAFLMCLEDCFPIWLIGIYTIWPIITERMLYILKCTLLTREDGTTAEHWDFDFNVQCRTADHAPAYLIAMAGLIIWSLGSIVFLVYKIKATGPENRFNDDNMRRFGYFYQGFEPQYWFWEIGWKRFDFLLVSIVTYTSLVPDARAKVIIYVMLGGVAMAAHMFCQPYDDRMHGLLDRGETIALLVRFTTFGTVAILLIAGGSLTTIFAFMSVVVVLNLMYLIYVTVHITSEVSKNVFTPNVDDADGDAEMEAKLEAAKKNMTVQMKILLFIFGPTLVAFHRQRALAEKHAVHLVWQGPMRNARFGKLPPAQQGFLSNMMRRFILVMFSLYDDSEVGLISKNCSDFWDYMMGMPSEVPSHGMDILILLVLANNRILQAGEDPSGANLIKEAEGLLKRWLEKNSDKAGRCVGAPAIPPRTVFVHGIDLSVSISSEQIVRFLVGFWRLPYSIALYVIHTLDVRLQQLQTHQVLPDEQIILKAFQTAVEQQIEQGSAVGKKYLESSGGVVDTAMWTDPLLKPFKPPAEGDGPGAGAGLDEIDLHFDNFDFLDSQAKAAQGVSSGSWLEYMSGMPSWLPGFGNTQSNGESNVCADRPQGEANSELNDDQVLGVNSLAARREEETTWQV
jgi:hypothetical protein